MDEEDDLCHFNGIDGATGRYLSPAMTPPELVRLAFGARFDLRPEEQAEAQLRNKLRFFNDRATLATFGPKEGVDPKNLAETGWGVIFAAEDRARSEAVKEALGELLALRRAQCGPRYREYIGPTGYRPNERADEMLARLGVGPGPADPDKVPYYLLIVGDPESIPYRLQYELDVQYAVGRIHFDTLDEHAAYARSVAQAEQGTITLPRRAAFFAPENTDDRSTRASASMLAGPLVAFMRAWMGKDPSRAPWELVEATHEAATKERLGALLGGPETPALLFTASHGMGFPAGDARQIPHQGALLCQDWPGPMAWQKDIPEGFYWSGSDVGDDARLHGLIAFHFACYSAGTPLWDPFTRMRGGGAQKVAARPFLARLPQRLLGHPRGGALAVIGHVERALGYSFAWPRAGAQSAVFESTLQRLLEGHPVGSALELFNVRYAELSTKLSNELDDVDNGATPDPFRLADLWTTNNDARGYAILGDPAVRLPGAASR
ncbi:Twin-arginine translocation protein TatB [Minicystis rosea]|nr:Twin-arginine translocation protein TatB [Minicystis rosea]